MASLLFPVLGLFATFTALLYGPVSERVEVFGIKRNLFGGFENEHGEGPTIIPDTYAAEDIHYYEPANLIFGIAEPAGSNSRERWFPPMERYDDSQQLGQAHFFYIRPDEPRAVRLNAANLEQPFVCHGFDIYADSADAQSLYFVAVNHLPNPAFNLLGNPGASSSEIPKARSQLEIFHHHIGDDFVTHKRSVHHPLIRTPNDIFAVDDTHFYVTNDHFYRAGGYRLLEDFGQDNFGAWSDLIYVSIDGSDASSAAARKDGIAGVTAVVALADLQNPNGLAHGRTKDEVILGRAASGIMHTLSPKSASSLLKGDLNITSTILLGSCMDNPSYFHDPYPNHGARDASGFVVAGLAAGVSWPAAKAKGGANPNVVWLVQPPLAAAEPGKERKGTRTARKDAPMAEWTHTRIWADDGRLLDSASTAVIVPIKPDEGTAPGEKEAWLFVTGPVSEAVVRTKIYL